MERKCESWEEEETGHSVASCELRDVCAGAGDLETCLLLSNQIVLQRPELVASMF